MKLTSILCLSATPLLVVGSWTYTVNGKTVGSGSGSHGCSSNPLRKGQQWKWNSGGSKCELHMWGEAPGGDCTKSKRLNFHTRGGSDGGPAETDHYYWNVSC
jgi:hypothetical protein